MICKKCGTKVNNIAKHKRRVRCYAQGLNGTKAGKSGSTLNRRRMDDWWRYRRPDNKRVERPKVNKHE